MVSKKSNWFQAGGQDCCVVRKSAVPSVRSKCGSACLSTVGLRCKKSDGCRS